MFEPGEARDEAQGRVQIEEAAASGVFAVHKVTQFGLSRGSCWVSEFPQREVSVGVHSEL